MATGNGGPQSFSGSTEPLVTDTSNSSESAPGASPRFEKHSDHHEHHKEDQENSRLFLFKIPIQEQWGYNTKVLNRLKMRREHELEEFNYGIDFT